MVKYDIKFRHEDQIFDDVEWIRKIAEKDYGINWSYDRFHVNVYLYVLTLFQVHMIAFALNVFHGKSTTHISPDEENDSLYWFGCSDLSASITEY